MATLFPAQKQTMDSPTGADNLDSPDHVTNFNRVADTSEAIQDVIGTTLGTNVLKNFTAGDHAARVSNTSVIQETWSGGTIDTSVLKTPKVNIINEEDVGVGVTVDGVKLKDSKVEIDSGERLGVDGSDNTTIGKNSVRPTRKVMFTNAVELLAVSSPASANWIPIDVTGNTSATTFAINIRIVRVPASAEDYFHVRPNGSTDASGHIRVACASSSVTEYQTGWVKVDSSQIFEHQANDTGGSVQILLIGYEECVD